jgi:cytoskeletal protein CcmA (bactofilin family)
MFNKPNNKETNTETKPVEIPTREIKEVKTTTAKSGKNSLISESITIKGEVSGSDNIDIYGSVEGNINLGNNDINIEKTANIKAEVVGKTIRINGRVVGNISANEKILATSNAHITGDIKAPKVELQDGSYFDGNISMRAKTNTNTSQPDTTKSDTKVEQKVADKKVIA